MLHQKRIALSRLYLHIIATFTELKKFNAITMQTVVRECNCRANHMISIHVTVQVVITFWYECFAYTFYILYKTGSMLHWVLNA